MSSYLNTTTLRMSYELGDCLSVDSNVALNIRLSLNEVNLYNL
jgi:hypothetical protein